MTSANFGSKKPKFTAEIRKHQRATQGSTPASMPFANVDTVSNTDLLGAIEGIYKILRERTEAPVQAAARVGVTEPSSGAQAEPPHDSEEPIENLALLRTELHALARSIEHTKTEISALRPPGSSDDHFITVTLELDAVVETTEAATETILDTVEHIDELAQSIQSQSNDEVVKKIGDDILDDTIKILEACNFQDLTGQRITKVINTLKFIEERVLSMIEIWGEENVAAAHRPEAEQAIDHDKALLNGPQMEETAISQDDIDALFD